MAESVEQIVRRVAAEEGMDADLLWAVVLQESGGNPRAVGDSGNSGGLYQENTGGRGAGIPMEQRFDPEASTRRAAREFKAIIAKNPGLDPGQLAVAAQRPLESLRPQYAANVNAAFTRMKQQGPAPAAQVAQAAVAAAPAPVRAAVGAAQAAGRYVWPLDVPPDQTRITTPYGGPQTISGPYSAALFANKPKDAQGRPINTGVDMVGGNRVVSPVDGVVEQAIVWNGKTGQGDNSGGYGNSVVVRAADGSRFRMSHLAGAPEAAKGERVQAGQGLGNVGQSGNATGKHLDFEAQDAQGKYFDPTAGPPASLVASWRESNVSYSSGPGGGDLIDPETGAPVSRSAPPPPNHPVPTTVSTPEDVARRQDEEAASLAEANPVIGTLQSERDRLREELGNQRALLERLRGPTEARMEADALHDPADVEKSVASLQSKLATAETALAKAVKAETDKAAKETKDQAAAAKKEADAAAKKENKGPDIQMAGGAAWVWNTETGRFESAPGIPSGPGGAGAAARTFQGRDGQQYVLSADGTSATLISGQGAAPDKEKTVKTISDPKTGAVYLQNPDGSLGEKLFDGKSTTGTATADGRIIGYDTETGEPKYRIDTMDPEDRALDRAKGAAGLEQTAATTATLTQKLEENRIAAALLQQARDEINAAAALPDEAERTAALTTAVEKYGALTDPAKAMDYAATQATARAARAKELSTQSGYQYDPVTMEPLRGADGQPVLTADASGKAWDRELDFGKAVSAHDISAQNARTNTQTAATSALESAGRYGLASPMWLQGVLASQAPVAGAGAAARAMGLDPESPIYKGVLAGMQASGALDANGMPKAPQRPTMPTTPLNQPLPERPPQQFSPLGAPLGGTRPGGLSGSSPSGAPPPTGGPPAVEQAAPPERMPVPGQDAIDLGDGRARTMYDDGSQEDWDIPQADAAPPEGKRPVPGQEAVDLGDGMARTYYDDGSYEDWSIGGGGSGGGGMGSVGWKPPAQAQQGQGQQRGGLAPMPMPVGTPEDDEEAEIQRELEKREAARRKARVAAEVERRDSERRGGLAAGKGSAGGSMGAPGGGGGYGYPAGGGATDTPEDQVNPLFRGVTQRYRQRARVAAGLPERPPSLTSNATGQFGSVSAAVSPVSSAPTSPVSSATTPGVSTLPGDQGGKYTAAFGGQTVAPSTPATVGAGTAGITYGYGVPGFGKEALKIRPEYLDNLQDPKQAPGYIPGSGTYNQFPLDQPGLFGDIAGVQSNLRYGLGGTGDPTTGREPQTPEEWVQGGKLFEWNSWENMGQTDATRGLDYIATMFGRGDTPSGIGTATWSAPKQYWDGLAQAVGRGVVRPTARGWQALAAKGYTPQGIGGSAVEQARSVGYGQAAPAAAPAAGGATPQTGGMGTGIRGAGLGGGGGMPPPPPPAQGPPPGAPPADPREKAAPLLNMLRMFGTPGAGTGPADRPPTIGEARRMGREQRPVGAGRRSH